MSAFLLFDTLFKSSKITPGNILLKISRSVISDKLFVFKDVFAYSFNLKKYSFKMNLNNKYSDSPEFNTELEIGNNSAAGFDT